MDIHAMSQEVLVNYTLRTFLEDGVFMSETEYFGQIVKAFKALIKMNNSVACESFKEPRQTFNGFLQHCYVMNNYYFVIRLRSR